MACAWCVHSERPALPQVDVYVAPARLAPPWDPYHPYNAPHTPNGVQAALAEARPELATLYQKVKGGRPMLMLGEWQKLLQKQLLFGALYLLWRYLPWRHLLLLEAAALRRAS